MRRTLANPGNPPAGTGQPKYFIIGFNKTGTTSVLHEFRLLGFKVSNYWKGQYLANKHYFKGHFGPIVQFCRSAQVFKDAPFSYPGTFRHIDAAFPGSKFILTVRDSAEQWYDSLTAFHGRIFGEGRVPTSADLRRARSRRQRWVQYARFTLFGFHINVKKREVFPINVTRLYGTSRNDPYNAEKLKGAYERHNAEVIEHFKERPGDLLVMNVARPGDYRRFIDFIGATSPRSEFPWMQRGGGAADEADPDDGVMSGPGSSIR